MTNDEIDKKAMEMALAYIPELRAKLLRDPHLSDDYYAGKLAMQFEACWYRGINEGIARARSVVGEKLQPTETT